jgi:ribonuclease HII
MALVCGIEEAGRGPVIGPMVICGVVIDEKDEQRLLSIGTKDSKLLTPKTREILFEQIKKMVLDYKLIIVPPQDVDAALSSDKLNLNRLEAQKMAELINDLKPERVILDCPSNNPKAYTVYLRKHLKKKDIEIAAEHKADVKYTVVAAASILAKVTRDREIKALKEKLGVDFGSGYPSDEVTQKFLKENWDKYPSIFRKSWISYKKVIEASKQKGLDEF